jgi:hypothetical protein
MAGLLAAVAEAQHQRAVGEARHAQDGQLETAASHLELDDVLVLQVQGGRRRGAHEQRVVPGDLVIASGSSCSQALLALAPSQLWTSLEHEFSSPEPCSRAARELGENLAFS